METRKLGTNGPELSALGLGCNNFGMRIDAAQTAAVVGAAIDEGITHFDTAEMYGEGASEEFLGAALGTRRDQVVIATKFLPRPGGQPFSPGDLARRITEAVDGSLTRLRTDRIDLYYQHYPDPDAPLDELVETLDVLVQQGKILSVGISNVDADQLSGSVAAFGGRSARPEVAQVEWNLLTRGVEGDIVPAAAAIETSIVPYFPLASGLLTGKYSSGEPFPDDSRFAAMPYFAEVASEQNLETVRRLTEIATDNDRSIVELALGWLLSHDIVASVIAGATTPEQVRANAAASTWRLDAEQLAEVDAANTP